jgi:hypothetical protein
MARLPARSRRHRPGLTRASPRPPAGTATRPKPRISRPDDTAAHLATAPGTLGQGESDLPNSSQILGRPYPGNYNRPPTKSV